MYFPILRGRQYELLALRELVTQSRLSNAVFPVIEPVTLSSTLLKTMIEINKKKTKVGIISNPLVGTFVSDLEKKDNVSKKDAFLSILKSGNILSAFYICPTFKLYYEKLISTGVESSKIMTININRDWIPLHQNVFSQEFPVYNLIPNERIFFNKIPQNRIMLADKFSKQKRNADYSGLVDESFSDDHLLSEEDGYLGFSDYSIIGQEYSSKGFAPHAVAIHIVYFDDEKNLRVRHFVSDSNSGPQDPAKKFSEALKKLIEWDQINKMNTLGIETFKSMYKNKVYPGLGTVKKLSVEHHIELMSQYLDGKI